MGKAIVDILFIIFVGIIVSILLAIFIAFIIHSELDDYLQICLIVPAVYLVLFGYVLFALRVVLMIPERNELLYDIAQRMDALLKIQYTLAIEQGKSFETQSALKEIVSDLDIVKQEA